VFDQDRWPWIKAYSCSGVIGVRLALAKTLSPKTGTASKPQSSRPLQWRRMEDFMPKQPNYMHFGASARETLTQTDAKHDQT
jgi:hypothetical protein